MKSQGQVGCRWSRPGLHPRCPQSQDPDSTGPAPCHPGISCGAEEAGGPAGSSQNPPSPGQACSPLPALTFLRIPGVCSVSSALADLPSHLRPTPKELTLLSTWRALSKKHPGPSQAEASTWVLQHTCSSCFRSRFCPGPRCPEFSANVGSLRSPGNLKTITRWLLPAPPHS